MMAAMEANRIINADCLDWMREQPGDSVDLVFGSPPYEAARTYGIGFKLRGQEWVDWMVERIVEMVRICKGLVAMVVEGQTKNYQWTASPVLLMADLHRRGIKLRKPPAFYRVGIPGSGGPDWLRNDYEFIVCCTKGKLPWSDNTAMGHAPKYAPGGEMSHRIGDGSRRNQWGGTNGTVCRDASGERQAPHRPSHKFLSMTSRGANGERKIAGGRKMAGQIERDGAEPKVADMLANGMPPGAKLHTKNDGEEMRVQCYVPPVKANPGNVIKCKVGGGLLGSKLAHENEAPFPERLAEFFVRSFCPPGGIVLDPLTGSGTTARVAKRLGRQYIALDVRQSQCELTARRLAEPEKPDSRQRQKRQKPTPSQLSLFA